MHSSGRNLRIVPASDVIVGVSGRTVHHDNVGVPRTLNSSVPSRVGVLLESSGKGPGHTLCGDRLVVLRVLTGTG